MKIWAHPVTFERKYSNTCQVPDFLCVGKVLEYDIPIQIAVDNDNPGLCSFDCEGLDIDPNNKKPTNCLFEGTDVVLQLDESEFYRRCPACLARKTR